MDGCSTYERFDKRSLVVSYMIQNLLELGYESKIVPASEPYPSTNLLLLLRPSIFMVFKA
jgi:hypothetical protein